MKDKVVRASDYALLAARLADAESILKKVAALKVRVTQLLPGGVIRRELEEYFAQKNEPTP
jgi:hypothetical protein